MKKNTAGQRIGAQLVSKTDGSAVITGTTTVYVTGDAGTQAPGSVGSGICTHEGNGYWTYAPSQVETNYDLVAFTFVNSAACNATVQVFTSYPQTGDSYATLGAAGVGLTALGDTRIANLDATVSSRLATAGYTAPDNATISAIAGYTDSIESRLPAALVGGKMDANITGMPTAADNAAAVLAAAQATPIHSNVKKINSVPVYGTGTDADPWREAP